ncbi:MAG TPA: GTP-binding protein [Rhodospirillales bacterium]|nr:GTP-binding protein [Rhodospirillales bacterium]
MQDKPARLIVQGVGERVEHYYDRPWASDETQAGQLVIIGLNGFDHAAVKDALLN